MEMALYEPGMGYYTSETTEIGKSGDYYTSPHLHSIFGIMLGKQIEEMWHMMERPNPFTVVEMGAGKGHLAHDMLGHLKEKEIFPALRYTVLELNPFMEKRQKALLSDFSEKIDWAGSLSRIGGIKGCILSNELVDALPVHLVEMEEGLKEIYVSFDGKEFYETKGPPSSDALSDYFAGFSLRLPPGMRTEVNLRAKGWLKEASSALSEGFILTVDYGYPAHEYYDEERTGGTLLCFSRHQTDENPYEDVGKKDITAHVNFSALKKWGSDLGLKNIGYCPQGTFLVSLGIEEAISEIGIRQNDDTPNPFETAKIKGLLMPGTIGETHKVLIQYKGGRMPKLRGFSLRNRINTL